MTSITRTTEPLHRLWKTYDVFAQILQELTDADIKNFALVCTVFEESTRSRRWSRPSSSLLAQLLREAGHSALLPDEASRLTLYAPYMRELSVDLKLADGGEDDPAYTALTTLLTHGVESSLVSLFSLDISVTSLHHVQLVSELMVDNLEHFSLRTSRALWRCRRDAVAWKNEFQAIVDRLAIKYKHLRSVKLCCDPHLEFEGLSSINILPLCLASSNLVELSLAPLDEISGLLSLQHLQRLRTLHISAYPDINVFSSLSSTPNPESFQLRFLRKLTLRCDFSSAVLIISACSNSLLHLSCKILSKQASRSTWPRQHQKLISLIVCITSRHHMLHSLRLDLLSSTECIPSSVLRSLGVCTFLRELRIIGRADLGNPLCDLSLSRLEGLWPSLETLSVKFKMPAGTAPHQNRANRAGYDPAKVLSLNGLEVFGKFSSLRSLSIAPMWPRMRAPTYAELLHEFLQEESPVQVPNVSARLFRPTITVFFEPLCMQEVQTGESSVFSSEGRLGVVLMASYLLKVWKDRIVLLEEEKGLRNVWAEVNTVLKVAQAVS